ncbi:uncharacterized protein [Epargyreus clarus]|uniref:uncharacterized protein isoform X2 n=1 Tax=Epargyreus clarus TaxID=520877 RepID=UPI003C2F8E44
MSSDTVYNKRRSKSWDYFEVVDATTFTAKCNICHELFSYRTSITNLMKHVRSAHQILEKGCGSKAKNGSPSEDEGALKVLEDDTKDEEESLCLLCQKSFACQDTNEVMEHMTKVHNITTIKLLDGNIQFEQELSNLVNSKGVGSAWDHFTIKDTGSCLAQCNFCEELCSYESAEGLMSHLVDHHRVAVDNGDGEAGVTRCESRKRRRWNPAWEHFTVRDPRLRLAACNTCDTLCSYRTNVSNLLKHVQRYHADESKLDKNDPQSTWFHKPFKHIKRKIIIKDHLSRDPKVKIAQMHEEYFDSNDDFEDNFKEQYQVRRRRPSSERPRSHLYHFANYVTSLLEQLPDNVSKKLQMDFVKQILEAQISCDKHKGENDLDMKTVETTEVVKVVISELDVNGCEIIK